MSNKKAMCRVRLTDAQYRECRMIAARKELRLGSILEEALKLFLLKKDAGEEILYHPTYRNTKEMSMYCDQGLSEEVREIANSESLKYVNVFTTAILDYLANHKDEEQLLWA